MPHDESLDGVPDSILYATPPHSRNCHDEIRDSPEFLRDQLAALQERYNAQCRALAAERNRLDAVIIRGLSWAVEIECDGVSWWIMTDGKREARGQNARTMIDEYIASRAHGDES